MALMAISSGDDNEQVIVESLKSQFRSWGDQMAAQDGDGLLVSMWYNPRRTLASNMQVLRRV